MNEPAGISSVEQAGRVLITFPWRERCASSILCQSLIDDGDADRVWWVSDELEPIPGSRLRALPRHLVPMEFRFDAVRGPRLLNSILFRTGAYHTVQGLTIGNRIEACAEQLAGIVREFRPAVLWGLAHYWNLPILDAVASRTGVPVHLTVHDEPVSCMFSNSRWPHTAARLVQRSWTRLLEQAASIDVVSEGMAEHIWNGWKRETLVVPPVPRLPLNNTPPADDRRVLRIGTSGCWWEYERSFAAMLAGLELAHRRGMFERVEWFWVDGENAMRNRVHQRLFAAAAPFVQVRPLPRMPEVEAAAVYANCHLLYLSCWNDSDVFNRTSNPSKLATYIPAVRPVIIHGPADSVAVRFCRKASWGTTWSSLTADELPARLAEALESLSDWAALRGKSQQLIHEHLSLDANRQRFWQLLETTIRSARKPCHNAGG